MLEIRFHGYGGEGIVTLAEMLASAAIKTGSQVQSLPSFGVERRGAPVKALLRISDQEIYIRSECRQPDILVVLNQKLLASGIEQGIKENGKIILNHHQPLDCSYPLTCIDATKIAIDENLVIGRVPFINIPLMGAVAFEIGIPFEKLEQAICEKWTGKTGMRNAEVAKIGYKTMQERRK